MSNTDFDPDAYLATPKPNAGGFNPDAYLQANAAPSFGEAVSGAVTGLPSNIYQAGRTALSTINDTLNPFSEAYIEEARQRSLHPSLALTDWMGAGRGLAAIPELAASPITGAVKSAAPVVAAPMTSAIQSVGEPIAKALNPAAQLPSRSDVYSQIEPQVEQALGLAIPAKSVPKTLPPLIPTTQQLYDAADGDYAVARAMDVQLHPQSVANFAGTLQRDLEKNWFRDYKAPDVFNVLKELQSPPPGSTFNMADVDGVRRLWGDAAGDFTNPTQQRAASHAIKTLDDYMRNIPQTDIVSGDAQAAQRILESARGNYAAAKRADLIESQADKAARQAGVSGSGANANNALRQKMNQILNNKSMQRGFSSDELDQIRQIAMGTPVGNLARKIGKLAPTGVVSSIPFLGAMAMGEPMSAAAIGAAGHIAKTIGERSTAGGVEKLSESTRGRSPLAGQLAAIPRLAAPRRSLQPLGAGLAASGISNPALLGIQGPAMAGAQQQNQQNIPGPPSQQKEGGAVQRQPRAWGGKVHSAKDNAKVTKAQAHYRGGNSTKYCSVCNMYRAPNSCTAVRGQISPRGLCDYFEKKVVRARGGHVPRRAKDGHLYVPDHNRPGKYLRLVPRG